MDFLSNLWNLILLPGTYAESLISSTIASFYGITASDAISLTNQLTASLSSVTNLLSSGVGALFLTVFGLLPQGGSLPSPIHSSASYFGNAIATVNFILPVSTLIYCLSLALSVKFALWALHILMMITNFIRGIPTPKFEGGYTFESSSSTSESGNTKYVSGFRKGRGWHM